MRRPCATPICRWHDHAAKRGAELRRVELAEQPAECVVAGQPGRQLEKTAQKRLLGRGEQRHIHRRLAAAQHRAQRDHQKFMKVMQRRIAGARILQILPAVNELIQTILPSGTSRTPR
jgi:hypothetical protein